MRKKTLKTLMTIGAVGVVGIGGAKMAGRKVIDTIYDKFMKTLFTDMYDENLWELYSSTKRVGIQTLMENNLRATYGKALERPMGSSRKLPSLEDLSFDIPQLYTMPADMEQKIDIGVTIGKYCAKPLVLENPIMIAAMAYGVALSKEIKIALAKGASMAGTATNTGAGPFLQEERKTARKLIYQYNRGDWGKTPEILQKCDAIEIQFGQGAYAGVGHIVKSRLIDKQLRQDFGIPKGKNIVAESRQPEVQCPGDLAKLVGKLKELGGGVPVGAKIGAGKYLEADLHWLCSSGVDFVVVDGAGAASKGSPAILQDSFGIPTVFAVHRAAMWMQKNGYKDKVSLVASGKISTPGDVLKLCALGADACYVGTAALTAVGHPQILKALPFEPPTTVTWYGSRYAKDFDINTGARALNNYLESCKLEIVEGIRALGRSSLSQVNRNDLVSMNETLAKGLGIPMAYEPFEYQH